MALDDGRRVHIGHRRLREGARVAVLQIPGLLRFDVERVGDTFSFALRNLYGGEQADGTPLEARSHRPPEGPVLNEYTFEVAWVDGPRIDVVARMPPHDGALESICSAYAFVEAP